jgi:phosphatidylserine decarboxylase
MLVILNVPAWMFIRPAAIPVVFTSISAILFLLVLNFFRSPRRHFRGNRDRVVVSSVDGTVVALERTYEAEYLKRDVIQLSVFMTVFNVHANWYPVDGVVKHVSHQNGKFLKAWLPKASTENERSMVVIETPEGHTVMARQIAGAMARRIVTYAQVGEECYIDEHMGFIKFGSRVDVYLPLGTEPCVKLGQKTTGNETIIAKLK